MFTGIPCIYTEMYRDVTTQILCVLIGQGCLSRPMIFLRCRSVYLRMFFTTIVAMVSEAFKPRARFSKAIYMIYIIAKYCIDIMIDLVSRAKHLLAFPNFKLSFWWFLKIILALFDPKVGIVLSKIYWLSTGHKSIAQPTAQNFATSNCRKIDDGNPNTDIYTYSETTFGGSTLGYGMTEN